MISQFATKKVWLTLKNYVSKNMNIKISIEGDCNYFTFTPIDFNDKRNATTIYRTIAANSELSVIVELMCNDNFPGLFLFHLKKLKCNVTWRNNNEN